MKYNCKDDGPRFRVDNNGAVWFNGMQMLARSWSIDADVTKYTQVTVTFYPGSVEIEHKATGE